MARVGFNHLHTTRFGPEGDAVGIPAQFGIQGIPQSGRENGGLPAFDIGGLNDLGSNDFLPSDEVSQTLQITDDFTKIYGKHSFKMGIEYQHVKFNTLQPAFSRGNSTSTASSPTFRTRTPVLPAARNSCSPEAATVPNGVDYSGGADQIKPPTSTRPTITRSTRRCTSRTTGSSLPN